MQYDLLTFSAPYTHTDVPDVRSYTGLTSAASNVIHGAMAAIRYDANPIITIPTVSDEQMANARSALYVAVFESNQTNPPKVIYTIIHSIVVSTASDGTGLRMTCKLNGLLTCMIMESSYDLAHSIYRIDRRLPVNYLVSANVVYPAITISPDDAPALSTHEVTAQTINYNYPDDYAVLITLQQQCAIDNGWTPYTELSYGDQVGPYTLLLWGMSFYINGSWTPIPTTVYTGIQAVRVASLLFGDLGEHQDQIYRVQLIPAIIALAMRTGTGIGTNYAYAERDGRRYYATPLTRAYQRVYATSVTPNDNPNLGYVADRLEAYGTPRAHVYVRGQQVCDLPMLNTAALPYWSCSIAWSLTAIFASGVEMYLLAEHAGINGAGEGVLIDKVAIAIPEIPVTANGLTRWQDTASRQWLSSVASVGMGLMTRGTSVSGAVTSLAQQAVGMIAAGNASLHEIHSAGTGASGVYATDDLIPWIQIKHVIYDDAALEIRDMWYRAHGVSAPLVSEYLPTSINVHYDYYQGRADVAVFQGLLSRLVVTQDELNAALNDQLASGVRLWHTTPYYVGDVTNRRT